MENTPCNVTKRHSESETRVLKCDKTYLEDRQYITTHPCVSHFSPTLYLVHQKQQQNTIFNPYNNKKVYIKYNLKIKIRGYQKFYKKSNFLLTKPPPTW